MWVHITVVGRVSCDIDIIHPHRRKAVLDAFAVEQFDARVMRRLNPPVGNQGIDISLARAKPQIALTVKIEVDTSKESDRIASFGSEKELDKLYEIVAQAKLFTKTFKFIFRVGTSH